MTQKLNIHSQAETREQDDFCIICNRFVVWNKNGKDAAGHKKPSNNRVQTDERESARLKSNEKGKEA